MKRHCLVCRLAGDLQKVEVVELVRGRVGQPAAEHLRVRIPLCSKHDTFTLETVAVLTREP